MALFWNRGLPPPAVIVAGGTGRNEVGLKGTALGGGLGAGKLCKAVQQY